MVGHVPLPVVDDKGEAHITRLIGVVQLAAERDGFIAVLPSVFAVDGVHGRPALAVLAERDDQIHRTAQPSAGVGGKLQAPARDAHQVFQIDDNVAPVAADEMVQRRVGEGVRRHLLAVDEHKFVLGGRIGFQCALDDLTELLDLNVHALQPRQILAGGIVGVVLAGIRLRGREVQRVIVDVRARRDGRRVLLGAFAVLRIDVGADFVDEVEGFLRVGERNADVARRRRLREAEAVNMLVAGIQPRRRVELADLGILLAVVRDQHRNGGGQADAVIELAQAADADVRDGLIMPFAEIEIDCEGRRAREAEPVVFVKQVGGDAVGQLRRGRVVGVVGARLLGSGIGQALEDVGAGQRAVDFLAEAAVDLRDSFVFHERLAFVAR